MAVPSQDQPTTTNINSNQAGTIKRSSWVRLVITIIAFILMAIVLLVLLTFFNILPPQWFTPMLTVLSPVFGAIGAFINITISDKDFQQSLRRWLMKHLFGDPEAKTQVNKASKDKDSSTSTQFPASITISPTITVSPTFTFETDSGATPEQFVSFAEPSTSKASISNNPDMQSIRASPFPSQLAGSALPNNTLTASDVPDSVFLVNMPLPNPKEFYGRELERAMLLSRARKGGCTSIIGPRRIGKTWLVTYLYLIASNELGSGFRVGYIDVTRPSCATIGGFTKEALQALGYPLFSIPEYPDLALLERVVKDMIAKDYIPILCIDEFEKLTHQPQFDLNFFTELRAITQVGLGMVVVSKDPLIDIVSENVKTSPFFNVFVQLKLDPFNIEDAKKFVQEKGTQAQFNDQEQAYLLAYGQINQHQLWPPLRLQLVGEMLLVDKRLADKKASYYYRPSDPQYWQELEAQVERMYQGMVKS